MARPKELYFIGDRDANGIPLEHFGAFPGVREAIPARDLTAEETAALTEAQWECIESPNGQRLYSAKPKTATSSPPAATDAPNAKS